MRFMVSEASVHTQFIPLLWLCGEADHHSSSIVVGKVSHLMVAKR